MTEVTNNEAAPAPSETQPQVPSENQPQVLSETPAQTPTPNKAQSSDTGGNEEIKELTEELKKSKEAIENLKNNTVSVEEQQKQKDDLQTQIKRSQHDIEVMKLQKQLDDSEATRIKMASEKQKPETVKMETSEIPTSKPLLTMLNNNMRGTNTNTGAQNQAGTTLAAVLEKQSPEEILNNLSDDSTMYNNRQFGPDDAREILTAITKKVMQAAEKTRQ